MPDMERDIADVKARLDKVEGQMSFLLRRLNIGAEEMPPWNASPAVLDLLRRGDRNGALRVFMGETHCSLKDAKRAIETLEH